MARVDDLRIDLPPMPAPTGRRRHGLWALVVLVGVSGTAWGVYRVSSRNATPERRPIRAIRLSGGAPTGGVSAAGYLEVVPPGPVVLSTSAEGTVKTVAVEGDLVCEGQVVAELDDSLQSFEVASRTAALEAAAARLARLEAGFRPEEIAQARAELARARARASLAELNLVRAERLAQVEAEQLRDTARAELASARAEVDLRTAELELRERGFRQEDIALATAEHAAALAELERARWRLAGCRLVAPFDGVVIDRFVRPGEWVSQDPAERRAALLTVAPRDAVQAWVDVNQREIARVHTGQAVTLVTDAQPDRPVSGRVSRLLPRANLQKNTVQVKVAIEEPPHDFRPDLSVRVTFLADEGRAEGGPREVLLPAASVVEGAAGRVVLVVEGQLVAERQVEVAPTDRPDHVRITSGLRDGDRVLLEPAGLKAGDAVTVEEP